MQYSQKHHIELEFAKKLIVLNQIKSHYIINLDLSMLHSSSLTGNSPVPKGGKDINNKNFIPTTYVPARNLIFLSLAVGVAEDNNIQDIFIGVNQLDYSGYPDCREDFISSFQETAKLATKRGREKHPICIKTPLLYLDKQAIIKQGNKLNVPYEYTWSCYDPKKDTIEKLVPCQECDSCILRKEAFKKLHILDPLLQKKKNSSCRNT